MQFRSDKLLSGVELAEMCAALSFMPQRVEINFADVPESVRNLIPYAEIWGENDDGRRWELVKTTPRWLRKHVAEVILAPEVQDRFDEWLAGPEASRLPPTSAYLAFSCLRMAADEMG